MRHSYGAFQVYDNGFSSRDPHLQHVGRRHASHFQLGMLRFCCTCRANTLRDCGFRPMHPGPAHVYAVFFNHGRHLMNNDSSMHSTHCTKEISPDLILGCIVWTSNAWVGKLTEHALHVVRRSLSITPKFRFFKGTQAKHTASRQFF